MNNAKKRILERSRRATRVRSRIAGTTERPRLSVRRTLKHIQAQIIDDSTGKSLVQISSASKEIVAKLAAKKDAKKRDASLAVGEMIAAAAKEKGITSVVFDRKGYAYQGRVKALAEAARKSGLVF